MNKPISMTSEIERMQASSAHRYAMRCQLQVSHDEERREQATTRLNAIVSTLADLSLQISVLEREVLLIADVLA